MLHLNTTTGRIGVVKGLRYQMFDEIGTGKTFARVAEVLPTKTDSISRDRRAELDALNPVHVDGLAGIRGYYVPVEQLETPAEKTAA